MSYPAGPSPYGSQSPYGGPGPVSAPSASPYAQSPYAQSPYGDAGGAPYAAYPGQPGNAMAVYSPAPGYGPPYAPAGAYLGGYVPMPDECSQASMAHWMTLLLGLLGFSFVGPLLYMGNDKTPFVRHHARQAMNIFLTGLIGGMVIGVVLVFLTIITLGLGSLLFIFVPLLGLYPLIAHMMAASKASNGDWTPVMAIQFLKG